MRKLILALTLSLILLLAGCTSVAVPEPANIPVPEPSSPIIELPEVTPAESATSDNTTATSDNTTAEEIAITAEPLLPETRTETTNHTNITYVKDQGIPELPEGFGIYGASVELDGVYPGWSGTVPLTLVNGQDRERLFVIYAVSPTKPKEGFEALPEKYLYWLTIEEPEVTVGIGEVRQVNITLEMPIDADYAGRQAEVRIRVDDTTQTGLVQIALECKWYIITAD